MRRSAQGGLWAPFTRGSFVHFSHVSTQRAKGGPNAPEEALVLFLERSVALFFLIALFGALASVVFWGDINI